jgi:hypothetical protein
MNIYDTIQKWMSAMYGTERKYDSMRCIIGAYMYNNLSHRTDVETIGNDTGYTEKQIRSELTRITRRLARYELPFQLKWEGNNTVTLIQI